MLFNKSKSTEVHFSQNNDTKKSGLQSNIETKKGVSPFKIFSLLKQQKMKEKENLEEVNPMDELIEKLTVDLKKQKTIDYTDEKAMEKLYSEKQKQCILKNQKIDIVEVVYHSMKKNKKNENDILILKFFFMHMEKFISLLTPLKVSISDLVVKLILNMKCEKKNKNNILFRRGDIGQKLYILLKGHVGIVVKKEKIIECTPFEYAKYLIVLHLFQEDNIIFEIIEKNKNIINIEEEMLINFFHVFKIFNFLKQNNRLKEDYKTIYDFVELDTKFNKFFENKYKYSPINALDIFKVSRNGIEQLYDFYTRKIIYMNQNLKLGLRGSDLFANFIKRQMNNTGIVKPTTQQELLVYLKPYDEGKKAFKNDEEYYLRIISVNEISPNKIMKTTVENYIQNIDPENILNDIRVDADNIKYKILDKDRIIQERVVIKTYEFFEVVQLNDGSIFGELALTNPNSKRTATIITKAECYFGTIVKQYYDISFRAAQEKSQSRNISFFTRSPIFKGINSNTFLNKFFYSFKKRTYKKGDLIYKRGEERKSVIFIIKGELEIGATITLKEINDLINSFGGIMNEKYMRDLLNSYEEFNKYFLKHKHKIKLCSLKDREIAGFDDMAVDGINMFDCICTSADKTELYELDYIHIKEAKKFEKIVNNINSFVNMKRKLFINILLDQRKTIITSEINKIKKIRKNMSEPKKSISLSAKNNKNFLSTSKDSKTFNKMILSYKEKQKDEYNLQFDRKKSKGLIKYEKDKSSKVKKFLTNSSNKSNKEIKFGMKNKNEDIDQILTSFNYNNDNKYFINTRIRSKIFKKKENNKEVQESIKKNVGFENNLLKIIKPLFLDDINSNSHKKKLTNQTYKPLLNNLNIYRTRKNLIPISKKSNSKNKKASLTPIMMKEFQKYFAETRNKIYINNFYFQRQKIFETLLDIDNETVQEYLKTPNPPAKKIKNSITQSDFSNQMKEQDDINLINYFNGENNKTSRKNQTNSSSLFNSNKNEEKKIGYKKNKNIYIDFLCLDNWEEKQNFTKRFLSENTIY